MSWFTSNSKTVGTFEKKTQQLIQTRWFLLSQ